MSVSDSWRAHAYPLKQLVVRVQGLRHSSVDDLASQLIAVAERLQAGAESGQRHDDDFGYAFELLETQEGPSFFEEACGYT